MTNWHNSRAHTCDDSEHAQGCCLRLNLHTDGRGPKEGLGMRSKASTGYSRKNASRIASDSLPYERVRVSLGSRLSTCAQSIRRSSSVIDMPTVVPSSYDTDASLRSISRVPEESARRHGCRTVWFTGKGRAAPPQSETSRRKTPASTISWADVIEDAVRVRSRWVDEETFSDLI
jgi:hypothetical protein